MNVICDPLAATGPTFPIGVALLIALGLLALGLLLAAMRGKRRPAAPAAVLLLVLLGLAVQGGSAPPAQAAVPDCSGPEHSLVITQTSTMSGMAPGIAPANITGTVQNVSTEGVVVTAITVTIVRVASPGACDASDFVLADTRMPVGLTLQPGEVADFAGASVGFVDKPVNQDGCKSATIHLLYRAGP